MLEDFILSTPIMFQSLVADTIWLLILLSPIYIPLILLIIVRYLWLFNRKYAFIMKQDRILLEIKIPKEIKKTPQAMEVFLGVLHQPGGESTWYDRSFKGKSRTWFSLEMVSIEGQVRFFIWTEKRLKPLIESQIYAQYPEVEIHEVDDYTKSMDFNPDKKALWGNEFVLTSKVDAYPIKTYVDYGLDKQGLESDEMTDPMTATIEFLGSIGKGEQLWIQIIIRAHKKNYKEELKWGERIKKLKWYGDDYDWTKLAKDEKLKQLDELKPEEGPMRVPTKQESEVVTALERNIAKPAFDVGIRGLYITEMDKFNPINITGMTGTFKQYNSLNLNGFRQNNVTGFNYPWQDWKNMRENKMKKDIFAEYKRRAYFYAPYKNKKQFVLSSEELATIFHIPGGVAQTPTFDKIESKKSEPPVNLPY